MTGTRISRVYTTRTSPLSTASLRDMMANAPATPGPMTAMLPVESAETRGVNLGPDPVEVTTNVTATIPGPTVPSDDPPGPRAEDDADDPLSSMVSMGYLLVASVYLLSAEVL